MNYECVTDMISDYLSGALNDEEKQIFFLHLTECAECRRTLADMLMLKRAAEAIAQPCGEATLQNAFKLVREEKKEEKSPLAEVMDTVTDALLLVRSTIKLTLLN